MCDICGFDRILITVCNLQRFTRNCEIKNLDDFETDEADARAGLLNVKEQGIIICYIMNRCLVMLLRGGKVNVEQYWWNIALKLKITLQMAQQLKTKNFNVVPGQIFFRQCKVEFLLETDSLNWWSR